MGPMIKKCWGRGLLRASGFSIVELMFAIVVLAVAVVLVLPLLGRVGSAAMQVRCSMQLKHVSDGLNSYADDNTGSYAIAGGVVFWEQIDPSTQMPSWMKQVTPYVSDTDVFAGCPSYPKSSLFHYFMGARAAYIDAGDQFAAVLRDKVRFPAAFVVTGDNNFRHFDELGPDQDADKDDYTFMTQVFSQDADHWAPQHQGLLNSAFADGHVAVFDRFDPQRMTYRYESMSAY
jgi:prepilin-type processing-associated H-X9-DG protein